MSSVADLPTIPTIPWINVNSKSSTCEPIARSKELSRRYAALSRLSVAIQSGTPEEWLLGFGADMSGMLEFDSLDIHVYEKSSEEIEWRSSTPRGSTAAEAQIEDPLYRQVFERQEVIRIVEGNVGADYANAKHILRGHNLTHPSFC